MSVIRKVQGLGFVAGLITGGTSATAAVMHLFRAVPGANHADIAVPLTSTLYWLIAISVLMLCNVRLVRSSLSARSSARKATAAALSDALTLLPNRRALAAKMAQVQTAQSGGFCGVLVIDLDHFKSVNDQLGHAAGDHVLQQVSARIRQVCGPDKLPFRTGGDEFVIVIDNPLDPASLDRCSRDLALAIAGPIRGDGWCVAMACSIGQAFGEAKLGIGGLMRAADGNMYHHKEVHHLQSHTASIRHDAGNGRAFSQRGCASQT